MNSNKISPKVHRYLYKYSIKKFLESKVNDLDYFISEYGINLTDDLAYSHLLDGLIYNNNISDNDVDEFLLDELNYGRARNVYVSFIQSPTHLQDDNNVIRSIQKLQQKGIKNTESANFYPYIHNLRGGIPKNEKHLIYFDIEKDQHNNSKNIKLLFSSGITDNEGNDCNNYIGVELNLDYNFLIIKLRNWESRIGSDFSLDSIHKEIKNDIKDAFNLSIPLLTASSQKLVYNMVSELSSSVLDNAITPVNNLLKSEIKDQLEEWIEKLLSEGSSLPQSDIEVMVQSNLNKFYKIYMQEEIGQLKVEELKDKFNVLGYPRYVKFVDDTVGEGRAKSSDPQESLLDTSIFYDIKARLDQAKQIRMATIYWIDCPGYDYMGTSFYTDVQERFKFVVLPNFFNKEMCDYVLRQINEYYRQ